MQGFLRDTPMQGLLADTEPGKVVVLLWNGSQAKYWQGESQKRQVINYQIISDSGRQKAVVEGSEQKWQHRLCAKQHFGPSEERGRRSGMARTCLHPHHPGTVHPGGKNLLWKCQKLLCVHVEEIQSRSKAVIAASSTNVSQKMYISPRGWCLYFTVDTVDRDTAKCFTSGFFHLLICLEVVTSVLMDVYVFILIANVLCELIAVDAKEGVWII